MKLFAVKAETIINVLDIVEANNREEAEDLVKAKIKRDYNFEPQYNGDGKPHAEVKETTCRVIGFSVGNTTDFM